MNAQALIAQLQQQRESWCELEPASDGKPLLRVRMRRPPEAELPKFRGGVQLELVQSCAVGWEGMSSERLLGAAVGSSDALTFDAALWSEIVTDRVEWIAKCAKHIADQVSAHLEQRAALLGNSAPSSTQTPA